MTRWAFTTCVFAAAWFATASVARADKVTLTNGDVLHGDVEEEGGRVRIRHAILGELDLSRSDVMWITKEGELPPEPAPAPPQGASSCCPPCDAASARAQERCPSPWELAVGFGISNDAGNTEKFQFNVDLDAAYRWRRSRLRWRVNSFYEEASGVQTEGKFFSNLSYARDLSSRGHLFGMWLVDRDDFADIELRSSWFAGYEYDFVKRKRTTLFGGLGAGGVVEKRSGVSSIETAALLARAGFRHEFSHGDTFEARSYWVPYLDHTERSPLRLELRYAHPLRDHLDIVAGFLADYVPDPPGDTKEYDTKITFGVRWRK